MEILYKELETLIKENNETYFKLNNLIYEEIKNYPEVANYFEPEFNKLEVNMENLELKNKPTAI